MQRHSNVQSNYGLLRKSFTALDITRQDRHTDGQTQYLLCMCAGLYHALLHTSLISMHLFILSLGLILWLLSGLLQVLLKSECREVCCGAKECILIILQVNVLEL